VRVQSRAETEREVAGEAATADLRALVVGDLPQARDLVRVNGTSVLRCFSCGGSGAHGAFVVICRENRRRSERRVAREDTARWEAATAM
jgi:hypothetical protein